MAKKRDQTRVAGKLTGRQEHGIDPLADLPDASPGFIPPMKAKLVDRLPVGEQWAYELKLDGYRALAIETAGQARLISRNNKDLSRDYPEIVEAVGKLELPEGVLDGEIVALDDSGKPSFQNLQHGRAPRRIFYYAFDLLNLKGKSLLSLPLVERKHLLERVLRSAPPAIRLVPFLEGDPETIVTAIASQGLEGIVAKLTTSKYEPDKRTGAWSKFKIGRDQDFVIGGFTLGQGGRSTFGSLIVGYYEGNRLRYASKVGTGFSKLRIRQILEKTEPLRQADCPFEEIPASSGSSWGYGLTAEERRTAVWLKPVLVCRVRFAEWTTDGHLRHPAFEGLLENKNARDVRRVA